MSSGKADQQKGRRGPGNRPPGKQPGGNGAPGHGRRDDHDEEDAKQLHSKLVTVLARLPKIEREVLEAKMGLVDGTPMKPGQVAERLGITIHEVQKIEARAFERIREIGPLKGLERFRPK